MCWYPCVLRFLQGHGLVLLGCCIVFGLVCWKCRVRLRALRERARLAREVEDALVQNAQGLIVKVHGIVRHLAPDDPLRRRVEQALDRADEQLSDDRDRVQDLRTRPPSAGWAPTLARWLASKRR